MTNVSSGSKRTWDGAEGEIYKRQRGREEPRDWRDVHLKSDHRQPLSSRHDSADRRGDDRRKRGEPEYGRTNSHGRDKVRRGDGERSRRDEREDYIRTSTSPRNSNGMAHLSDEREEGEISPRPSTGPSRSNQPQASSPLQAAKPTAPSKPPADMELDLAPSPPPVEDTLATRRARRQAILAKYNGLTSVGASPSPGPSSAVQPPLNSSSISDPISLNHSVNGTPTPSGAGSVKLANGAPGKRESMSTSPSPGDFTLAKNDEQEDVQAKVLAENAGAEQVSAADYDPSLDRREDEQRRGRNPLSSPHDMEEIEEEEEEEDVDDMFAVLNTERKKKKVKKVKKIKTVVPALITTTLDSAADHEGYYSVILGEQLDNGRYQVFSSLGKGMFANVVRARVLQQESGEGPKEVAIKIIRCQESMHRAGLKEAQILNKLKQADPEDKKHIVRLDRTFEHRGHLCLVFESMSMNLRDVVKRFGKDVGLNIRAVRAYAHQLFLALSLLRKTNIMHADIKPDNILVNEQKTVLKLCDLGSASDASENDITPYLVSRFYRAPEIILGVPYDPSLDIWSIGCTLYELYTGKILFPGRSNNQMLLLMMELKGRFNSKMIKKAKFGDTYFDDMGGFVSVEKDRVTGTDVVKKVHVSKPSRDLRARLMPPASVKMKDDENKMLVNFIDLLDKCLALDPARRITPREALAHPFIRA